MATTMYGKARDSFLNAGIDWGTANLQLIFVTTGYTPAYTTDQYYTDVTSGAINAATPSGNLSSVTSSLGTANAANETVSSVSGSQFAYVILFKSTGTGSTSPLIMNIDTATGLPCTPNGGNIVVQWDTGTNKIFTLCHEVDYIGRGAWATIRDGVRMLFDRTYTGRLWVGVPSLLQMPPTDEQAAKHAVYLERVAKAREIRRRHGATIPILGS